MEEGFQASLFALSYSSAELRSIDGPLYRVNVGIVQSAAGLSNNPDFQTPCVIREQTPFMR